MRVGLLRRCRIDLFGRCTRNCKHVRQFTFSLLLGRGGRHLCFSRPKCNYCSALHSNNMHAPMVGMAAPRLVHSCTIRNNSGAPVRVHVLYRGPAPRGSGNQEEVSGADVPAGGVLQAGERVTNHGSYQTRKEIAGVKVTRMNGQKQKLMAPFNGVHSVEVDWLFVVDDWQIHSMNPRAMTRRF